MERTGTGSTATVKAVTDADVRQIVREAHDREAPLRIVGRGTWLRGGRPVQAVRNLDLSELTGIVEYVPGDLTLTARAGTTLAELAEATHGHGQWLPLDPFGDPRGTLGATLATASTGPLGASIGRPRDLTVGLGFVTGDGQMVRGGGRVVKNVAGFDLVRMTIGAWGTLGVIVEATVRLRARPEADETVLLPLPTEPRRLAELVTAVRNASIEPLCAEMLNATLTRRLVLGDDDVMLVRLAGNAISVRHQRDVLARLAAVRDAPEDAWTRLRESDPPDAFIARISRRPSELSRLWAAARAITGAEAHATLSLGIVRVRLANGLPGADHDVLAGFDDGDVRLVEQGLPRAINRPTDRMARLTDRLRLAFDPRRILNRGILGESAP